MKPKRIDNRKLKGIFGRILSRLDPDGKRGLTLRLLRDWYREGDLEVREAHRIEAENMLAEKKRKESLAARLEKEVIDMIDESNKKKQEP